MDSTKRPAVQISTHQQRKARLAGTIGNVVEWYDFALYGYLAAIIGRLFFPNEDPSASLLASYGVFAAGFVMRPLGGTVFGWLGDTIGRGRTMLISVAMMAFPTVALGLLPDYHTIGFAAPVLLVIIRMIQGLSVGGEFSSSVTYMVETAPADERGRAGSWANVGSMTGMLLGSGAAAAVTTFLAADVLDSWGWRLPFLFGGVIGLVAIVLRRNLPRSPHFQAHEAGTPSCSPFRQIWMQNRTAAIQAFLFAACYGMVFYLVMVYLPGWLAREGGILESEALQVNSALTLVIIPLMVLFAWIGDKWIRRTRLIAVAFALMAIVAYPVGVLMIGNGIAMMIAGQAVLVILLAVPLGSAPATFVELFPSSDRLTGYSISFNLGIGVVGGATPALATWLIVVTGHPLAPAWLLIAAAILAGLTLLWMRDRSREPLR
ncbi:MAG TPA: MFS transporter [Rhizobiales bacterium]|nr:MFS transporter [Hyphomicrobiales bacterium]